MPKKVFESLSQAMVRDIKVNYHIDDKYRSVREIASKFSVSLQTAHKGQDWLADRGYIEIKKNSGAVIKNLQPVQSARKICVVSANFDKRFNEGYMAGILKAAGERKIKVTFKNVAGKDLTTVSFGNYLLSFNADGIIALYMRDAALPFYHVIREGQDIVSDIIIDGIPSLPAIQTDNHRHGFEAGKMLLAKGYQRFLLAGYRPKEGNRRYEGFLEAVKVSAKEIQYGCLSEQRSIYDIDRFFSHFDRTSTVFSDDYSANYILAAKFVQFHIKVNNNNFMVYDADGPVFDYNGLFSAKAVGPSLVDLGAKLCGLLLSKWDTGSWPEPLQTKI
jgi:DNA-binding LacI/PurR family transcriptional regulator